MGAEVARVPRGSEVASEAGFGAWLCRERRLRGLSVFFVAARAELAPERVEAIEAGDEGLADDPAGRALARSLAEAVGADPQQALLLLGPVRRRARASARRMAWTRIARWGAGLLVVTGLGVSAWMAADWWRGRAVAEPPDVVYRTDYVDELLDPPDVGAR